MRTFRTRHCAVPSLVLALLLGACGGGGGGNPALDGGGSPNGPSDNRPDANNPTALTVTSPVEPGPYCAEGGQKVEEGMDADGNGAFDSGEVISSTKYQCNTPQGMQEWLAVAEQVEAAAESRTGYGYMAINDAAQVVVSLPADADLVPGDTVRVKGPAAGGWKIDPNGEQVVGLGELVSWTPGDAFNGGYGPWTAVASSYKGLRLAAVSGSPGAIEGLVYVSENGGASWSQVNPLAGQGSPENTIGRNWSSVACSDDCETLAVGIDSINSWGWVWISKDFGKTWFHSDSISDANRRWRLVASSRDGAKLLAAAEWGSAPGGIFRSVDGGAEWKREATIPGDSPDWRAVASSADGSRAVAAVNGGLVYTAVEDADGALQWTAHDANQDGESLAQNWVSVASSRDGKTLVAAPSGGRIHVSADYGVTWVPVGDSGNWKSLSISGDGREFVALKEGQAYTFTNDGGAWNAVASPAEVSGLAWNAVAISGDGSRMVAGEAVIPSNSLHTRPIHTTPGTGSISGGPSSAIELLYRGNGMFDIKAHEGDLVFD